MNRSTRKSVFRGEIWKIRAPSDVVGSEQAGSRPVLILQNDTNNLYSPTTIGAYITSKDKDKYARLPTHVLLKAGMGGLPMASTVMLEQIVTFDKQRLFGERIGRLPEYVMDTMIAKAILVSLGMNSDML